MIRRTIENLKVRPHHERRAVATLVAYGVVGVLLLAWAVSFFTRLGGISAPSVPAALNTDQTSNQ